jgi:cyclopropane-fatty-acyl-phospholipid synthase
MNVILASPETESTLRLLNGLLAHTTLVDVGFRLWDGTAWPDQEPRAATIVLKHPGAVREMFASGTEKGLAEAFIAGHFDVEGDLEAACELADALAESAEGDWLLAAKRLFHLRRANVIPHSRAWTGEGTFGSRRHSRTRDRRAIAFHYDVSNDFFRLWLDTRMLYSCAYFEQAGDSLERAQRAKLQHICRKLRLRPGMRLLDIGCGWGGLAIYAAREYGVHVTGVTLSEAQASLASTWVGNAGLSGSVEIRLTDYRELDSRGSFDAITSVGMAEHVGSEHLRAYFEKAFSLLKPGGAFLNHAIGEGVRARAARGGSFIQKYVFPDSNLQRIPQVLSAAESAGFEIRDVENLREHYTLTLRHWVRRLEGAREAALELVDEATCRIWRLYMAGSAHGFARGRLAVYQTLLSKGDQRGTAHLPLTRRDWYESHQEKEVTDHTNSRALE